MLSFNGVIYNFNEAFVVELQFRKYLDCMHSLKSVIKFDIF